MMKQSYASLYFANAWQMAHSFCQYYVKSLNCDKLLCPSDTLLLFPLQ